MLSVGAPANYTVDPMSKDNMMTVEVAYALPHKQALLKVEVPVGATVLEAAQQSGIASKFDGVDLENAKFGIFGQGMTEFLRCTFCVRLLEYLSVSISLCISAVTSICLTMC